jgi:hypothetical protein
MYDPFIDGYHGVNPSPTKKHKLFYNLSDKGIGQVQITLSLGLAAIAVGPKKLQAGTTLRHLEAPPKQVYRGTCAGDHGPPVLTAPAHQVARHRTTSREHLAPRRRLIDRAEEDGDM